VTSRSRSPVHRTGLLARSNALTATVAATGSSCIADVRLVAEEAVRRLLDAARLVERLATHAVWLVRVSPLHFRETRSEPFGGDERCRLTSVSVKTHDKANRDGRMQEPHVVPEHESGGE
jgi:hypothetical protein